MKKSGRPSPPRTPFKEWILWEDQHFVAVDKPAGVLSQGGEGAAGEDLVSLARKYTSLPNIGVLHRLDRNVSGVVLLAKTPQGARGFHRILQAGRVERCYLAVCLLRAELSTDSFAITAYLSKDERENLVTAVSEEHLQTLAPEEKTQFQNARSEAKLVERWSFRGKHYAAFEMRPITGRSHQLRVHLAFMGYPILGDPKYGVLLDGLSRPLLHSQYLRFKHPLFHTPITIEAKIPWDSVMLVNLGVKNAG